MQPQQMTCLSPTTMAPKLWTHSIELPPRVKPSVTIKTLILQRTS
jgi:hypothetical protein